MLNQASDTTACFSPKFENRVKFGTCFLNGEQALKYTQN